MCLIDTCRDRGIWHIVIRIRYIVFHVAWNNLRVKLPAWREHVMEMNKVGPWPEN
ncbi:MAG TPA: hypothetical protein PJ996_08650 [Nitrosomonas sp.]|nr:hypothetical protein [Nitrosomonas sp.]HNC41453.1 hypothetical protein [Nitrosomonas sp.]